MWAGGASSHFILNTVGSGRSGMFPDVHLVHQVLSQCFRLWVEGQEREPAAGAWGWGRGMGALEGGGPSGGGMGDQWGRERESSGATDDRSCVWRLNSGPVWACHPA